MLTMNGFFYCYSERLKRALLSNGFKYVCEGINKKTKSKFYLFVGTEELNNYKNKIYQTERDKF